MVLSRFTNILGAGIRAVRLYDEQNNRANVDRIAESLGVIDVLHHRTHQGVVYTAGHIFQGVTAAASVEVLIQVPAGQAAHMRVLAASGGDGELRVFEGTTFSGAGTGITPRNRNRFAGDNSAMTVSHTPTGVTAGTELSRTFIPGGHGGAAAGGTTGSLFEEFILQTSENYLVRVTNTAGSAQDIGIELTWYEPDLDTAS